MRILFSTNSPGEAKSIFSSTNSPLRFCASAILSFKPGLTVIGICDSKIEATPNQVVVSVATLTNDSESFSTGLDNVEYQCVGILPESVRALLKKTAPIHIAIFDGIVNEMVKKHTTRLKNFNESMKARVSRDSFLTTDDVSEDSGIIL